MTEPVFAADPARLLIAAAAGIVLLLLLIIKFKIHPVLSLLISALFIGLGAGMPVPTLVNTVEKGAGETLQGIVLLIGLGSLFGGILEVSGGAQCVAQTLVSRFGEKKAGIALGITGLVVGTTVFFEAGVVILIPLAFGLAKKTKKIHIVLRNPSSGRSGNRICIYPSFSRFRTCCEYAECGAWNYDCSRCAGRYSVTAFRGNLMVKIYRQQDQHRTSFQYTGSSGRGRGQSSPIFHSVMYHSCSAGTDPVQYDFRVYPGNRSGTSCSAVPWNTICGTDYSRSFFHVFLGKKMGYNGEQLKKIMDHSLKPTGLILLVITGGGIIRWVLQDCRNGKYHRACPGKKRAPVSAGGIFDLQL